MDPQSYIDNLTDEKREVMQALRQSIHGHLPVGFQEVIQYGMISYVVPHSIYPSGYHCDPRLPLPFVSIAAQKSHYAVYHMGLYADAQLMAWFTEEYPKYTKLKLDMGKSCIRFKKPEGIPFSLLGELASKMTPQDWVTTYEKAFRK